MAAARRGSVGMLALLFASAAVLCDCLVSIEGRLKRAASAIVYSSIQRWITPEQMDSTAGSM
jgi:hypothetical protein